VMAAVVDVEGVVVEELHNVVVGQKNRREVKGNL
jgi:hypothetical protein